MRTEALDQELGHNPPVTQRLEEFLLTILEQYDGLCLDNEPERLQLATALAIALATVAREPDGFSFMTVTPAWLASEQEGMFPPPTLQQDFRLLRANGVASSRQFQFG